MAIHRHVVAVVSKLLDNGRGTYVHGLVSVCRAAGRARIIDSTHG